MGPAVVAPTFVMAAAPTIRSKALARHGGGRGRSGADAGTGRWNDIERAGGRHAGEFADIHPAAASGVGVGDGNGGAGAGTVQAVPKIDDGMASSGAGVDPGNAAAADGSHRDVVIGGEEHEGAAGMRGSSQGGDVQRKRKKR